MRTQPFPRGLLASLTLTLGFGGLSLTFIPACGGDSPTASVPEAHHDRVPNHDVHASAGTGDREHPLSPDSTVNSDSGSSTSTELPVTPLDDLGASPEPDEGPSQDEDTDTSPSTPPGECTAGSYREGSAPCGADGDGLRVQRCDNGQWADSDLCLLGASDSYDALNLGAGYGAPEWDYDEVAPPARGVYGWSYYIRAFDLIRDTPVKEIGWGQWSKPSMPADGLDVCGLHPHGFTCEEVSDDEFDGDLASCGHLDWQSLESCRVWCCAEDDKCGVRGSIEGGMGYWMYTLQTPHVKWMLPGATNANYEIFGGTFLHDRPQSCTTLGGAVRVSNRLLVPNDFVSFSGDDIDGFLGYMLTRTPLVKRSASDNANAWTIVIHLNDDNILFGVVP